MRWRSWLEMVCGWREVVFIHLEVDRQPLATVVPFDLDLFEGRAFVSLVAFFVRRFRPRRGGRLTSWTMAPIANYPLLNLRAYVVHDGRPAIFFLREWMTKRIPGFFGPRTFGLPYHLAQIEYRHAGRDLERAGRESRRPFGAVLHRDPGETARRGGGGRGRVRDRLSIGALSRDDRSGSKDTHVHGGASALAACPGRRRNRGHEFVGGRVSRIDARCASALGACVTRVRQCRDRVAGAGRFGVAATRRVAVFGRRAIGGDCPLWDCPLLVARCHHRRLAQLRFTLVLLGRRTGLEQGTVHKGQSPPSAARFGP